MNRIHCILFLCVFAACARSREYTVVTVGDKDGTVTVDGRQVEPAWTSARVITSFRNPWNRQVCPPTSLSLVKDDRYLYFYFEVSDTEIVLEPAFSGERDVEKEDRVELFLSKDAGMEEYYCFEIDASGRTLSYAARTYRQLDFSWDVPAGFEAVSRTYPGGYAVEGRIPITFIEKLSYDHTLYFGAYRAEFSRKEGATIENWLTWIDPKTASPDFHVPATLGKMYLQ